MWSMNLHEEFPELEEFLRTATLVEVSKCSVDDFGVIGGAIVWLTDDQFLWLLPVLVLLGRLSEDSVYAGLVISELIERIPRSREWPRIKKQLSSETLQWLLSLSEKCVSLGWEDERRITKRGDACKTIFQENG